MLSLIINYPTRDDVKIAKNFLYEKELQVLNLLVSQFLDFAELQALEENPMTMKDWIKELDNHLLGNKRPLKGITYGCGIFCILKINFIVVAYFSVIK